MFHIKFTPAKDTIMSRHEDLIPSTTEPLWPWVEESPIVRLYFRQD